MAVFFAFSIVFVVVFLLFMAFIEEVQDKKDDGLDPHERYLNARHKQIDKIDRTNGW